MARKASDPNLRQIRAQLAPPDDLDPELRELWDVEFARFPPGWFVPADMRALLSYLDVTRRYYRLAAIVDAELVKGALPARNVTTAMAQALNTMIRLQSALRMHPATRQSKDAFGHMARDPGNQAHDPSKPSGWRGVMEQARQSQGVTNVTELPVTRRGPGRPRKQS